MKKFLQILLLFNIISISWGYPQQVFSGNVLIEEDKEIILSNNTQQADTMMYINSDSLKQVYANKVALADFRGTTEIDNVIEDGAFDAELSVNQKSYYLSELQDCSQYVLQVGMNWQEKNNLKPLLISSAPGETLIHLYSKNLEGFFEIYYRLFPENKKVKVSFYFFGKDASNYSAVLSDLEDVDNLVKQLELSLSCQIK